MNDNNIVKANDILSKFDFFGGQRAGRELWNEKPVDVQDEDIKNFSKDVAFLKDFINRQKAEIERLTTMHSEMCIGMKRLKSEAYREFAERLCKDRVSNDPVVIAVKVELKELTEK